MSRYDEIIATLDGLLEAGRWAEVIVALANEVFRVLQDPRAKAMALGSPEFDRCCLAAGELAWKAGYSGVLPPFDRQLVVHVATELHHKTGGHTLALKDVVRAQPHLRHVILVTNLHDQALDLQGVASDLDPAPEIRLAPPGSVVRKTEWLHAQLRELRPGTLILFQHHHDAVAIAGALPYAAHETFYFHHCDHEMALGIYLPHAFHVDCSTIVFEKCRDHLGVENQVYWPLVSPDRGGREGHVFMKNATLTTCSHGREGKFLAPGRYAYLDLVTKRLQEVGGIHIHLGHLPAETVASFVKALESKGIDPSRFRQVPPVASLWDFLRDSDIDLCITSFPVQGGKGLVETMGAGIPILIQQSTISKVYSSRDGAYEQALWWQNPRQFIDALQSLTPESLVLHSEWSRRFYEMWHHPRELAYALSNARHTADRPPTYPFRTDTLAQYYS